MTPAVAIHRIGLGVEIFGGEEEGVFLDIRGLRGDEPPILI